MQDVIFTKYSLDRDDRFKIRTDIVLDESGKKVIKKSALTSYAQKHIEDIFHIYEMLNEFYESSGIKVNECNYNNDELQFPYIEGKTFAEILDNDLEHGNINKALKCIEDYCQFVRGHAHPGFDQSESFKEIFGEYSFGADMKSLNVADVNLLFDNIIINERWNIIDYEWTFLFDIPADFIIYRAISDYIAGMEHFNAREELQKIGIGKITGIKDKDLDIFKKMNDNFLCFIIGQTLTGKEMQKLIGKPVIDIKDKYAEYLYEMNSRKIQLFYDYGNGFSEENSVIIAPPKSKNDWFEKEIQIPEGCKNLRIDPMNGFGYLELESILLDEAAVDFELNGETFDEILVFNSDDPQIIISDVLNSKKLYIKFKAILTDENALSGIINMYKKLQDEIIELKKNIVDLKIVPEQKEISVADEVVDEVVEADATPQINQQQPVTSKKLIYRIIRWNKYLFQNGFRNTINCIKVRLQAKFKKEFDKEPLRLNETASDLRSFEYSIKKVKVRTKKPQSIAVHLHLFYVDLLPEFVWYLNNMPYSFDLYVSCQIGAPVEMIEEKVKKIKKVRRVIIRECENRGRDIAPLYVWFKNEIQSYEYFLHIHSKKSLHAGSEKIEWRQMSLDSLLGSKKLVRKIFSLFNNNKKIGLIFPEFTDDFCMYDPSWLRNEIIGKEFLEKLNIVQERKLFFFPAGSFFWAQTEAVRPLFDIGLRIQDFPEEQGQVDSTLAHVLERAVACVAEDRRYNAALIDLERGTVKFRRSYKLFKDYLKCTVETAYNQLKNFDILSFDIFGTLITSHAYNRDTFYRYIEEKYSDVILSEYNFVETRKLAEKCAKNKYGDSMKLIDIYECLANKLKINVKTAYQIMEYEIDSLIELSMPRKDIQYIYESLAFQSKKIVIVEDTYYSSEVIKKLLKHCGYKVWQDMWISCEIGKRKDTGELWDAFFDKYINKNLVHVGDNPSSDWYRIYGRAPVFWVMNGTDEFYMSSLYDKYSYLMNGDYNNALELGKVVNEEYFNSPFALSFIEEGK